MTLPFEELDYQQTPKGELILQRRLALDLDHREVYEVKLNDEYLMSSLFVDGEEALARKGLEWLQGSNWDIVVGGLGLGYTAVEVLKDSSVREMIVVEALAPVISWHEQGLVPNGPILSGDDRCSFNCADFFTVTRGTGFVPDQPGRQFDGILLDIDHTPDALLNPDHASFYSKDGLQNLKRFLKPGGVFALWSNEAPAPRFSSLLSEVWSRVEGVTVEFENPLRRTTETNGVYLASDVRV
jgi:spermidine synthase